MRKLMTLTLLMIATLFVSGCYEESVTVHTPGVYKRKRDPLLGKPNADILKERFNAVQTDR